MMAAFKNPKGRRDLTGSIGEWADDEVIGKLLEYEHRLRTLRGAMFDHNVLNDSSWPIVQRLFLAHLKAEKIRTKELYAASGLPQTTVLRYVDHLEKCEVVRRENDPEDSRVTLVSVTEEGAIWMREYYSQVIRREQALAKKDAGVFSLDAGTTH